VISEPLTPPVADAAEHWLRTRMRKLAQSVGGSSPAAKLLAARETVAAIGSRPEVVDLVKYLRDDDPDEEWSTYQRIVEMSGGAPDEVIAMFGLGGEWAASGASERACGVAMQLAIADLFAGPVSAVSDWADRATMETAAVLLKEVGEGIREVLATVYTRTQKVLSTADGIVAYRGVGSRHIKSNGCPSLLPLSSWSLCPAVAAEFPFSLGRSPARRLLMAFIPRQRVLSVPETGFASLDEQEVAVIAVADVADRVRVFETPPADDSGISASACWTAAIPST